VHFLHKSEGLAEMRYLDPAGITFIVMSVFLGGLLGGILLYFELKDKRGRK
jgi:presenilin-like A22 family membrane protease